MKGRDVNRQTGLQHVTGTTKTNKKQFTKRTSSSTDLSAFARISRGSQRTVHLEIGGNIFFLHVYILYV